MEAVETGTPGLGGNRMSVYIKGMEMPKDGFITITVTSDCRVVGNSKKESGKFEYLKNEDIAKAVPVPEHGRLCNKDDVLKVIDNLIWRTANREAHEVLKWAKECLSVLPTIIPADPAKEGEMSLWYPCVYCTEDLKCTKYSDDEVTSYCLLGTCHDETKSNADRIRQMSDEGIEDWYWWMHKEMMRYTDSRVFVHDWLKASADKEVDNG